MQFIPLNINRRGLRIFQTGKCKNISFVPEPSDIIWHQRLDLDVSLRVVLARGCLDSEPGIEAFASDIDKAGK